MLGFSSFKLTTGDVRSNTAPFALVTYALFVLEHNFQAKRLS